MHNSDCIICGKDLKYLNSEEHSICSVCGKHYATNVKCINNHFICDNCHQADAIEYIENYCKNNYSTNVSNILIELMRNQKVKMHGPEHHFIVPATLLTSYYNVIGKHNIISEKLEIAKNRAKNIPGGFCGFYGNCGAGVGTGIYMSIITEATPLSTEPWKLCNLMTSKSLEAIANHGGPRCCKRDSFLAIETAADFTENHLNVKIPINTVECEFYNFNKDCKKADCKYYPKN